MIFLRYYGCTICQLDLMELEENIDEFKKNKVDIKVVLQSSRDKMLESLRSSPLSYEIICDPDMRLYQEFNLEIAKSKAKLGGGITLLKLAKAKKAGIEHGEYEGEEMQLPAIFIVDKSKQVVFSHYAKNVADIPSSKEILKIIINKK